MSNVLNQLISIVQIRNNLTIFFRGDGEDQLRQVFGGQVARSSTLCRHASSTAKIEYYTPAMLIFSLPE